MNTINNLVLLFYFNNIKFNFLLNIMLVFITFQHSLHTWAGHVVQPNFGLGTFCLASLCDSVGNS